MDPYEALRVELFFQLNPDGTRIEWMRLEEEPVLFPSGMGLGLLLLVSLIRDVMWEQELGFPARSGIDTFRHPASLAIF